MTNWFFKTNRRANNTVLGLRLAAAAIYTWNAIDHYGSWLGVLWALGAAMFMWMAVRYYD